MFPKRYQKSVTKLSFPLRQLCHSVYSQSFQKYALMKVLKMIRFMRTFMRIFLLRISEIILKLIHLKNVLQTPISPKSYKKLYLVSLRCLRLKPCCSALTTRPPKGAGEDPFRPNLGRAFNSRQDCKYAMHSRCSSIPKWTNLELKTRLNF